jgi:cupin 2 domain-containing protein
MQIKNFLGGIPLNIQKEVTERIISNGNVRIERIISRGQSSPENFWYDQEENEWVILIKGRARLSFYDENKIVVVNEGDYLDIPAHKKHRVEWTDPDKETIWLAVFY